MSDRPVVKFGTEELIQLGQSGGIRPPPPPSRKFYNFGRVFHDSQPIRLMSRDVNDNASFIETAYTERISCVNTSMIVFEYNFFPILILMAILGEVLLSLRVCTSVSTIVIYSCQL